MKRFKRKGFSFERVIILSILFIIQLIWFYIMVANIFELAPWFDIVLQIIAMIIILYLVMKDDSPAYRISWSIAIGLFPIFGTMMYILIGNKRPTTSMRSKIAKQESLHSHEYEGLPDVQSALENKDERLSMLASYVTEYAKAPLYTNSQVDYFPNGESMMEPLLEDLRKAEKTIFIEFFIVEFGDMLDAIMDVLVKKVAEGVEVCFIYDDFGCITRLPNDFDKTLEKLGIKAMKFNPVKPIVSMVYNTRDHRKFIIIDNETAYTGGLNIADEYINVVERFGYWKDNMIRINGPAVWNLSNLFLNMWNAFKHTDDSYDIFYPEVSMSQEREMLESHADISELGFVQPFGDSPLDREPIGENVYREILNLAKDYVYIYTPYLVISYELQTAMTLAAKRGVKVYLMTPGIPDKKLVFRMTRSYYRPLIEAGVKIYEYTPGFLHAKTFVADDKVATVGTINLDYRSLYLHFETSTLIYYHPVIKEIKQDFEESISVSKRVSISDTRLGWFGKVIDSILRLIAPFV